MEEHIENKNSIIMSYLDLYELITFFLILIIKIITYYKTYTSIFSPILIFIILFITRLLKFKSKCLDDKLDYDKLFGRCIILLSIYLYSEYTVKCIPILNLIFNKLFEFPLTGKILKSFFSFLMMHLGNKIINNFNYENDPKEFISKNEVCKLEKSKINLSLFILGVILFNSYLESYKIYISTKKLLI